MPLPTIVLVDTFGFFKPDVLNAMAAAYQTQLNRDVAPPPPYGWGVSAQIRVASNPKDVTAQDWGVCAYLEHPDAAGALGYHYFTAQGKPYSKCFPLLDVKDGSPPSLTSSHELVEMVVNPIGARCAQSWDGRLWAAEACDAVEADRYKIGDVWVSNFVLPPYFEPVPALGALKQDFMNVLSPRTRLEIRPGGYGQYWSPTRGWVQVLHPQKSPRSARMVPGRSARLRALGPTLGTPAALAFADAEIFAAKEAHR